MVGAFTEPPLDDHLFIVDMDGVQRIVKDIHSKKRIVSSIRMGLYSEIVLSSGHGVLSLS